MKKPLVGALTTLLLTGATVAGAAAPATAATPAAAPAVAAKGGPKANAVDFAGTVALSNCSGSVVRMPDSQAGDPALVMTNGHCLETGTPDAGEVVADQPSGAAGPTVLIRQQAAILPGAGRALRSPGFTGHRSEDWNE